MDIGKIGLTVAGIAILLAIPLSVVANLLTPPVQSWYSTTSQKRLKKRIRRLESALQTSERQWTFTLPEWAAYKAGHRRNLSLFFGLLALSYCSRARSGAHSLYTLARTGSSSNRRFVHSRYDDPWRNNTHQHEHIVFSGNPQSSQEESPAAQ